MNATMTPAIAETVPWPSGAAAEAVVTVPLP